MGYFNYGGHATGIVDSVGIGMSLGHFTYRQDVLAMRVEKFF